MIFHCLAVIYVLGIFHTTTGHLEMNVSGTADVIMRKTLGNNKLARNSEIQDPYNINIQSRFVELVIIYDNKAMLSSIGQQATLVAHQLGHSLGMQHDEEHCHCPESKCIMTPSWKQVFPTFNISFSPNYWSSCSKDYLYKSFERGLDYCLRNKPKTVLGPSCGNGFVENGEECDCGLQSGCENSCCNATSCTLSANASCATGSCCNLSTCRVHSMGALCRHVASECDLPEYCDGISEVCPKDIFKPNGVSCGSQEVYCADGQCNSHDDQCKLLWGPSGKVADKKCFEMNTKGNSRGNCGYFIGNGTSKPCSEEDVFCGLLHCTHSNERLEFGLEPVAILSRSYIASLGRVLGCHTAVIDLGLDVINPGLVPNGAKCGENKMCFNQQCIPVDKTTTSQCIAGCEDNQGGGALKVLKPIVSFIASCLFS